MAKEPKSEKKEQVPMTHPSRHPIVTKTIGPAHDAQGRKVLDQARKGK